MDTHHHPRRHHLGRSVSSELEPNHNEEIGTPTESVVQLSALNAMATVGSSGQEKCSLSDIWRMSSPNEVASKLVLMTQAPRICAEMRADGVLPLLVQLLHQHSTEDGIFAISNDNDNSNFGSVPELTSEMFRSTQQLRRNSSKALRNIILNTSKSQKELQILGLLEDLRSFVEILYLKCADQPVDTVDHPCCQMADIFNIAYDQESKQILEMLGGVYVISDVSLFE